GHSQRRASTSLPLCFCFRRSGAPLAPSSFPTRRSSDLEGDARAGGRAAGGVHGGAGRERDGAVEGHRPAGGGDAAAQRGGLPQRSEEHTSELQSPYDLVCRLLLEKKKHKKQADRSCKCQ